MQKDSYDFDTKRKYHEQLEQFIRRFYDARLRKKRFREAIRVACFPGHEGLEVLHVYDKLGLPRENIVGLERDPDIAQQIEDLKLGIQVENKTDAGFFEETPDKFDIVNLDYQGIVAEDSIYAIQLLAGRPIFNDKAILGTNFLGKRETDGGNKYKSFSLSPELVYRQRRALEAALRGSGELIDLEIEAARLKERAVGQKTIRQLRSDSITIGIIYALLEGKLGIDVTELERALLDSKEISPSEEIQEFKLFLEQFDSGKTIREKYDLIKGKKSNSLINRFMAMLTGHIRNLGFQYKIPALFKNPESVAGYVMMPYSHSFYAAEISRGRYISDKGSAMLYDLMYVKRLDKEFPLQSGKVKVDSEKGSVSIHLTAGNDRTFFEIIENTKKLSKLTRYAILGFPLPEREFLGSSYRPKSRTKEKGLEKITADEAKLLLDSGCTPEEITECYSGLNLDDLVELQTPAKSRVTNKEEAYAAIGQLREGNDNVTVNLLKEAYDISPDLSDTSLKAYLAVDTTNRRKNGEPRKQKPKLNSQAVIDDLAVLPEETVMEKHSLTTGQLRAIKAHQTMGRYEEPLERIQYLGATIEGRGNVLGTIQRLEKRYGSLDNIPSDQLEHHNIRKH